MTPGIDHILDQLMTGAPQRLDDITSHDAGIYALYDHEGRPAYIGMTEDFRHRIWANHASGDGNSHKFSTAYNAGRMFHARKDPRTCQADGPIAKKLRTLFAREYCRAVTFALPGYTKHDLDPIEVALRRAAPAEAIRWNDSKAVDAIEPTTLVDQLLAKLSWSPQQIAAIERQAARHRS